MFELVPLEALPAFDAAKTLKTMLLSSQQIRRLNDFRRKWRQVISVMLQTGNLLMLLTTLVPRRVGYLTSVLSPILQIPGMLFILASMRVEMMYLLFGTYDFWYFTVNNIIFGVCFTAILADIRIIVVLFGCSIVQISIFADALVGDRYQLFLSSLINCLTHFVMFVAVLLRILDDEGRGNALVLSYSSTGYGFSIRDTLMNTQLNMILLFGRLVYRNWVAMREQGSATARRVDSQTSYIPSRRRCVSYYCTVGLRPKRTTATPIALIRARTTNSIPSTPRTRTSVTGSVESTRSNRSRFGSVISIQALDSYHTPVASRVLGSAWIPVKGNAPPGTLNPQNVAAEHRHHRRHQHSLTKIQLQFVPAGEDFSGHNTLVPGFGRLLTKVLGPTAPEWRRTALLNAFHGLGYGGMIVLVLGALVAWLRKDQNLDNLFPGLARTQRLALAASVGFCGVFFASYQRQLLKRLYSSFNFLFLTTKLTVASLALCQFFALDHRVIWVWGAWIWMQWAITLDALPPSTMRLLAFRRSTLMISVLAFEMAGLIILSLELFVWDRWIVPNRTVIDRVVRGHHITLSTLSALVSRLWTIFLWDCKLMWFLSAAYRRQRQRRLSAVDISEVNDDDEGERLILVGRVEFFYEWAAHNRPKVARERWTKGLHILRATQSLLRRQSILRRRTRTASAQAVDAVKEESSDTK